MTLPRITSPGKTYQLRWVKKSSSSQSSSKVTKSAPKKEKKTNNNNEAPIKKATTAASVPGADQKLTTEEKLAKARALKEQLKKKVHEEL